MFVLVESVDKKSLSQEKKLSRADVVHSLGLGWKATFGPLRRHTEVCVAGRIVKLKYLFPSLRLFSRDFHSCAAINNSQKRSVASVYRSVECFFMLFFGIVVFLVAM